MSELRFAVFGSGFWSRFQLGGWSELDGARCVAICDPDMAKAKAMANAFSIPAVYDDAQDLLSHETLDFVDIVTDVDSHGPLVNKAADHGIAVICQKPMGPTLEIAEAMVQRCLRDRVPFFVHENWRWQAPLRAIKAVIDSGRLGNIVRGRIDYANSFPVFDNQPFLKQLDRFILTDIGTHILDVARFLWGEASELFCLTRRIRTDIRGEDVATVMMRMTDGVTVTCNMSYASKWEFDRFPETMVAIEGTLGGVSLGPDFTIKVVTDEGTEVNRVAPQRYPWSEPAYALIHSSIVQCNQNLLTALQGGATAETTAEDNLETLKLVFACYESAAKGQSVRLR